ncbi:MAG: hypothetical protein LBN97_06875 [Oscillospiraceae bacterium]|nr:hypothetical protein [Oscillospiraceae bacterium]
MPTKAEINALITVAVKFNTTKVWEIFESYPLCAVCLENGDEYFFTANRADERAILSCLVGVDGLRSYFRTLKEDAAPDARYAQRSIDTYFANGRRAFDGFGFGITPYEWQGTCCLFLSLEPYYIAQSPNAWEAETLTELYTELLELLEWLCVEQPAVSALKLETPVRYYDSSSGKWLNEVHKLKTPPEIKIIPPVDEISAVRLKRANFVNARLELDVILDRREVRFPDEHKPYYPRTIYLADTGHQKVLMQVPITPQQEAASEVIAALIAFISKYGKPEIIQVQSDAVHAMLIEFCDEEQIQLKQVSFLPTINAEVMLDSY